MYILSHTHTHTYAPTGQQGHRWTMETVGHQMKFSRKGQRIIEKQGESLALC